MGTHSRDVLAQLSPDVPAEMAARAQAWSGTDRVVEPALSASVILLRDGAQGLESYLLHRHARMPFAPSMVVFPGGRVDPGDGAPEPGRSARDPVRACALRETFEETAVRLADEDLHPWALWTTPEIEPRRFQTHFFVAALPVGQEARDVSGETDRAAWTSPSAAVEAAGRGDIALMPPTLSMLLELAAAQDAAAVLELARDRVVEPVLPRLTRGRAGWSFRYPTRS